MKISFTGHRPPKLFYLETRSNSYDQCLLWLFSKFLQTLDLPEGEWNSGAALGLDTAIALEAIRREIPFNLYLAYDTFGDNWWGVNRDRLAQLKQKAHKVITVSEGAYSYYKLLQRNKALVDNCDILYALWDGSPSGTENCISYAKSKNKTIVNLWDQWANYYEQQYKTTSN